MTYTPQNAGSHQRWPGERPFKGAHTATSGAANGWPSQQIQHGKQRSGCSRVAVIIFAVFFGSAVLAGLAGVAEDTKGAASEESSETGQAAAEDVAESPSAPSAEKNEGEAAEEQALPDLEEPAGPTFQGMKNSDEATVPMEPLVTGRVGYTTGPLQQASRYGTRILCATVAIVNQGATEVTFGYFEWKLQDPDGVISTPTILDGGRPTLTSWAELAPEGSVQGDVCFDGDATELPGEYVLFRDEVGLFSNKRMAWVNSL